MAKQTFTTGQVLTAAQMTSLQQTAMGGGAATAKTASYVLVAADAGTTVAMNAAGATTITVNTGLFAAGDTVFIQNLGAGACTVTAGTATVATAGSLILPQNDAGILYFTATGTAIFYDYIQAGAVSPLTTKGDLYTFSTSDARLGVGANGTTLVADSSEATGLKWATASSGDYVKITSADFSSVSSVTINDVFSATYNNYKLFITTTSSPGTALRARWRVSGSDASGANYEWTRLYTSGGTVGASEASSQTAADISDVGSTIAADITIYRPFLTLPTLTTGYNLYNAPTSGTDHGFYVSAHSLSTSYTGMTFYPASSTMSGNYALYGMKA